MCDACLMVRASWLQAHGRGVPGLWGRSAIQHRLSESYLLGRAYWLESIGLCPLDRAYWTVPIGSCLIGR